MSKSKTVLGLLLGLCFFQCSPKPENPAGELDIDQIEAHIKTLASDAFQGRKPGTPGGEKTVAYLEDKLKAYGVSPVQGSSFRQTFSITELKPLTSQELSIESRDGQKSYTLNEDFIANTRHFEQSVMVERVDLVFVGFGIEAPEWDWNDYDGIDVKGKIVISLYSDPGVYDSTIFNGKRATPHAFIESKKKLALSKGALGLFTVMPDPRFASANWEQFKARSMRSAYYMDEDKPLMENEIPLSGMLSLEAFKSWLASASYQPVDYVQHALSKRFRPVDLGLKASLSVSTEVKTFQTHNVIGMVKGSERPDEHLIYTAHWDHDGIARIPVDGDSILNGAVDNASGTAMVLETARVFSQSLKKPERSVLFFFTAAEEMGLLGAEYYAENPLMPLHELIAVINTDASHATHTMGEAVNVVRGYTSLDSLIELSASSVGRSILDLKIPEAGIFKRSDHYPFVKKGIPAVWAVGGSKPIEGDSTEAMNLITNYVTNKYHKVIDEYHEGFLMGNIHMDARFNIALGHKLVNSRFWPQWTENKRYMALRDSMNLVKQRAN